MRRLFLCLACVAVGAATLTDDEALYDIGDILLCTENCVAWLPARAVVDVGGQRPKHLPL